MAKQRKTKKTKIRSSERKLASQGFTIDKALLKTRLSKAKTVESSPTDKKYFKADLTKTLLLTMLVLALELAIWNYLSRH